MLTRSEYLRYSSWPLMYLVPIHVPIYLDGDRRLITTEWYRSLQLLRDSLRGRFGQIAVAAPSQPATSASIEQKITEVTDSSDDIVLFPDFDFRCRAREYWLRHRAPWQAKLAGLVENAAVVHAGLDDIYRPIAFEGFRTGLRLGRPTVFVQDTDIVIQQRQLAANRSAPGRVIAAAYSSVYEQVCRWSVARADLSLLKGSALMKRYGHFARNAKEFHDTSYFASDIATEEDLERRLATLSLPRPLRLVYCGRLIERKGVDRSLLIIARARSLGASLELDVIGEGAESGRLEKLAKSSGINLSVRFLGSHPYGPDLLKKLSAYDALLFTPTAEDTPRMIFDGYAAGLPLVAFGIGYVQERHLQERATYLLPKDQIEESASMLMDLDNNRGKLADLARMARVAAQYHSSDNWYRQRADWTVEAVGRHNRASNPRPDRG
jgi:glycosyltransferase involved in cell wall biosynthesis